MSSSPRTNQLAIKEPPLNVLNLKGEPKCVRSALDLSKDLQKLMLRMKGSLISDDGHQVKYNELSKNNLFQQYEELVPGLRSIKLDDLNEAERSAFFINVYNSLTIHGLGTKAEAVKSVLDVQLFWKSTMYNIAGHNYSLDDIEHGILRGNRPHPASRVPPFEQTDPRLKFCINNRDPRIHFALVCGAKSCPAINVYTGENLDRALEAAAKSFCEQEVDVCTIAKEITVSQIFQWFQTDFGVNDIEAIRWTLPYLNPDKQRKMDTMLAVLLQSGQVNIKYHKYDWSINAWCDRPTPTTADHLSPTNGQPPRPRSGEAGTSNDLRPRSRSKSKDRPRSGGAMKALKKVFQKKKD